MNNDKVYLLFAGYHSVAAASDLLTGYHIVNRIVKAPANIKNSCSFAVLIDKSDESMAKTLLDIEKKKGKI